MTALGGACSPTHPLLKERRITIALAGSGAPNAVIVLENAETVIGIEPNYGNRRGGFQTRPYMRQDVDGRLPPRLNLRPSACHRSRDRRPAARRCRWPPAAAPSSARHPER